MTIKLKGIEIDAFRAYQESQLFNFLNSEGDIANLVVIYAPNGYGKTSFYDAIEWVFTGKINRISDNGILRANADSEQGNILKNIKSGKSFGRVKVITEDGEVIEKKTKELGRYGRKSDYAEGDIISKSDIFNDMKLGEFITNNLLGQDKVDSFLRFSNPRDRFDVLSNFWDSNNEVYFLKSINGMYIEVEKELKLHKKTMDEVTEEIKSLVLQPTIINEINSLITAFNNVYSEKVSLDFLTKDYIADFISKVIKLKSYLIDREEKNNEELLSFEYLFNFFEIYKKKIDENEYLKEKLLVFSDIRNKFNFEKETLSRISILSNEITRLNAEFKNYNFLEVNYKEYNNITSEMKKIELMNIDAIRIISETDNRMKDLQIGIKRLNEKIERKNKNIFELEKSINGTDKKIQKYIFLNNRIKKLKSNIDKLEKVINSRKEQVFEINILQNKYNSWLKFNNDLLITYNFDETAITPLVSNIKKLNELLMMKKEEKTIKEKEYHEYGELTNKMNDVVKIGLQLIKENELSNCPLCHVKYNNYEELLINVNKDLQDKHSLKKITDEINLINLEIKNFKGKIKESISVYQNYLYAELEVLNNEELKTKFKNQLNSILLKKIQAKTNLCESQFYEIENFFQELNFDISNKDFEYLNTLKKRILKKAKDIKKSVNANNEEKKQLVLELKLTVIKIDKHEKLININKNKVRELQASPLLGDIDEMLVKLKVELDIDLITEVIEETGIKITSYSAEKEKLEKQSSVLKNELKNVILEDIIKTYNEIQFIIKENKIVIKEYNENKKKVFQNDEKIEFNELKSRRNLILTEEQKIKKSSSLLNQIDQYNIYIEKSIESKNKENQKQDLNNMLEVLVKAKNELFEVKNRMSSYIERKIEQGFNLDTINSVYQRIDPHPDFYNIKLTPDLNKNKPELNIYASSDEEKLSPILYFSSAQVNILSLSIFLARALVVERKGINTIFMDDPIQHLDTLNVLSFIDLLRTITVDLNKQIVISTHDESFYKLIKRKMDPDFTSSKYIELESFGRIKTE